MPKAKDKTKGALNRRKASGNSAGNDNDDSDTGPASNQKKPQKKNSDPDPDDGIAMSEQLAGKVRKVRHTHFTRSIVRNICDNGKPLSSADLEKMYDAYYYDRYSDEKPSTTADVLPVRCVTPDGKRPVLGKRANTAAASKENERIGRTLRGSPNSSDTVSYEYTDNLLLSLPSTSKDHENIHENQALKNRKKTKSKNIVTLVSPDAVAPDYQTEVVTSSNISVPIPDEIVINTNARAGPVQASQQSNPSIQQNNPPGSIYITPQDSTPNRGIAEVITNFVNEPERSASCSYETVDLIPMKKNLALKLSEERLERIRIRSQSDLTSRAEEIEKLVNKICGIGSQSTRVCRASSQINTGNDSVTSPVTNKTRTNQLLPGPQNVPAKTRVIPSPSQQKDPGCSIECPICMESLSNSSIASTLCGHVFCIECLKTALRANGNTCPICRKQLPGVGYHELFL